MEVHAACITHLPQAASRRCRELKESRRLGCTHWPRRVRAPLLGASVCGIVPEWNVTSNEFSKERSPPWPGVEANRTEQRQEPQLMSETQTKRAESDLPRSTAEEYRFDRSAAGWQGSGSISVKVRCGLAEIVDCINKTTETIWQN